MGGGGAAVPAGAVCALLRPEGGWPGALPPCGPLTGPSGPVGCDGKGPGAAALLTPTLFTGPPGPTGGAVAFGLAWTSELVTVVLETWREPEERRPDEEPAGLEKKNMKLVII